MKAQVFCLLAMVACSKNATPSGSTKVIVALTGQVSNLFAASAQTASASSANFTSGASPLCAGPLQLGLTIYNVVPFLLAPKTVTPLGTCDVSASDGTYNCTNVDITGNSEPLVAVVDDKDNATSDCAFATAFAIVPCSTADIEDPTKPSCGSGKWLADGVITSAETQIPSVVVPKAVFDKLDGEAQTLAGAASFASLDKTGAVLSIVTDAAGAPVAGIAPFMPASCRAVGSMPAAAECRAFGIGVDNNGLPTILDATSGGALQVTQARLGLWLGQLEVTDPSGNPVPFVATIDELLKPLEGYGGVDCSGDGLCIDPSAAKPVAADERGPGTAAIVFINFLSTKPPAADGNCSLLDDFSQAADPNAASVLACP